MIYNSTQKGFLTLMGALIVAAVGLSISISLLMLGLATSRTSFVIEQSYQASSLADACAEEALQQIFDSMAGEDPEADPPVVKTPYTGTGNLNMGQGTCTFTVSDNGTKITASGTVGTDTITRKSQIILGSVSPITILSWQEVSDFTD